MPLRVMGYDGAEYRAQLLADQSGADRYPVVTMVLYFGYKKPWDGPVSLKERLNIPAEFANYVNDYKLNLFQIAYLTREQVQMFRSDFRIVADYFVQKRENGNYIPSSQEITHVQETLQLLSIMTNDHRFEEVLNESTKEEGGPHTMCDVLDRVETKGMEKGMEKGEDMVTLLVKKLLDSGRLDDVKRITEDKEYRRKLLRELSIN